MHSSVGVLLLGAVLAVHGQQAKPDAAKGYFDSAPQPAYPQQSAAAYPQQPPVYYQPVYQPPQYALPNVDVNYCTVHSSFPMVERRHRDHDHHRRDRRQAYGGVPAQSPPISGYGQSAPAPYPFPSPFHGHHNHGRHRFEREHCRYSAIWNRDACQRCCQVASVAVGTDTSQVTGALFVFDPKLEHGSFDHSKEHDDKDDKDKRVLQCICCLPKPV